VQIGKFKRKRAKKLSTTFFRAKKLIFSKRNYTKEYQPIGMAL
jgi:hypothetical protein